MNNKKRKNCHEDVNTMNTFRLKRKICKAVTGKTNIFEISFLKVLLSMSQVSLMRKS